jgi:hypothetical protein
MSIIPRRKLNEIAFIYDRHPEQCDVYVEGTFDKDILTWFFRKYGLQSVCIYTIDSIEIPDGEIISAGRKANNRERTVLLSEFLSQQGAKRAICLVDADFAHLRQEKVVTKFLLLTDYSCMEMYLFTEESISKFFTLCCHRGNWPVVTIMDSLSFVLQELFIYRFANEELNWEMDWLDGYTCMQTNGWQVSLNIDNFIIRFLHKNKRFKGKEEFLKSLEPLRKTFKTDHRHQMHGHDFIYTLSWYIRAKGITGQKATPESVLLCLSMSADHQKLAQEPMFKKLMIRLSGP